MSKFKDGPLIEDYGKHAPVESVSLPATTKLKVAFDVADAADAGKINRRFDSLARFLNMHVAAGVPPENIELALVVHGKGAFDLLDNDTYQKLHKQDNPNKTLLTLLMKNGVDVYLCGQTANAYEVAESQLIEGAKLHLSAMTAHALLKQEGYSLNPF
jgi:intracellular sulfur oxidation DsrE/DsrF family protein